ncbi:MAG: hypothetical protein IH840_07785 [Candidatus Heimdallarchaeota archaeon]|nr:hypothetical protein [Candidatus Heimdallarchaeota archaeon]
MSTSLSSSSTPSERSRLQQIINLLVGIMGFVLPAALYYFSGETDLRGSMSSYYHTDSKPIFIGYLIILGFLLIIYQGYGRIDNLLSVTAGLSAWAVALFPTVDSGLPRDLAGYVHVVASTLLFLIIAYFCLRIFTKRSGVITSKKIWRDRVYKLSGYVILFSLAMIALPNVWERSYPTNWTFGFEYLTNTAFGLAWITKANGIFFLNEDPISRWTLREFLGYLALMVYIVISFYMIAVITPAF